MNIWEAYCKPEYYNIYFAFLKAKGIKAEEVETIKSHYTAYIQRIKNTSFASDLKKITSRVDFINKLKDIFFVKWADRILHKEMPDHYLRYIDFLDTIQALHNDYIDEDEKRRLIYPNFDIPIIELSPYEKEYMVDGKLVALANPQLIYILRRYIEYAAMNPDRLTLVCRNFYGDLLPKMESEDYQKLIKMLWSSSRQVRRGGGRNKIKITYPDGHTAQLGISEAILQVIEFYGFDEICKFKPQMRGNDFLVKRIPYGQENNYREIHNDYYVRVDGNYKDNLNMLRLINIHYGRKLVIDLC
jgi:hypothetical protein